MKKLILAVTMLIAANAQADGFVCTSEEGLRVKVYNQVQPELGTRNPAVMIVSDDTIQHGRKTIARFSAERETLVSAQSVFLADVDLRYSDSSRKGELIAGTKLGELSEIALYVNFSYRHADLEEGDLVDGSLVLTKRNGDLIPLTMVCERYLKN